jgi:hypothetical protein
MTFLIVATVSAAVVYFVVALLACLHDCLMVRYRRQFSAPVIELDYAALSHELGSWDELLHLTPAPTAPALELPSSIRGLREFVRAENLQDSIKQLTGKSVSNLKKDELWEAVRMAIA